MVVIIAVAVAVIALAVGLHAHTRLSKVEATVKSVVGSVAESVDKHLPTL